MDFTNLSARSTDKSFSVPAGFREAEGPTLVKFTELGQTLRGLFLKAVPITLQGDNGPESVLEVYLQEPGGRVAKFRPSYDIKEKLNKSMLGKEILVRYMSDDANRGRNGNAYKVFGVWVKDREADPAGDTYSASDDDIPF